MKVFLKPLDGAGSFFIFIEARKENTDQDRAVSNVSNNVMGMVEIFQN